jgi:hypothetical protein
MDSKPKLRWYQFSLKWLLVVMTLLGVGPGAYVAYEQNKARKQIAAAEAIQKLGGHIISGDVFGDDEGTGRSVGMRWILGDNRYERTWCVNFSQNSAVTDADLVHLQPFHQLNVLDLAGTQVTDAGLLQLSALRELRSLDLTNTRVTDAGLSHVAELKEMGRLDIEGTRITDDGLAVLETLPNLETLCLNRTQVTDAGMVHLVGTTILRLDLRGARVTDAGLVVLARKPNLEEVYLASTMVTDTGTQRLQKALPKLKIVP